MSLPGFIPFSRASFIFDLIAVALLLINPLMFLSYRLAKKKYYNTHKSLQLSLTIILLFTILIFELDVRLHGWKELTQNSSYHGTVLNSALFTHIAFASTTLCLWGTVLIQALRFFPKPLSSHSHARFHKRYGLLALISMLLTSISGWIFYWLAFVA